MTKVTIDRALIEQALEAIELNWKTDEGDAVKPLLRAALAEPAPAPKPVTRINLESGRYLKFEPYHFLGPMCWRLYTEDDKQIRALDEYERCFVDAALKVAPVREAEPAPEPVNADLRDRLVAISSAISDQDDRAAQAMLREILSAPGAAPVREQAPVPLLTDEEVAEAGRLNVEGERMLPYSFARAIEQAVRQKAGLK